jgi:hypothetical protein
VDQGIEESRKRYAEETGYCGNCNALLTDEISQWFATGPSAPRTTASPTT